LLETAWFFSGIYKRARSRIKTDVLGECSLPRIATEFPQLIRGISIDNNIFMFPHGICFAFIRVSAVQPSPYLEARRQPERTSKATIRPRRRKAFTGKVDAGCAAFMIVSGLVAAYGLMGEAAQTVSLGAAQDVAILGGNTITNTGPSTIIGNVALSPGTEIIGFPPGTVTAGTIHIGDALARQAQADTRKAYEELAGEGPVIHLSGRDLGGMTLGPGVYNFPSSAQLTGTLKLNTEGNPDAVFIFQTGSRLTTASDSTVILLGLNGASDPNIFWQVGSSATIGTDTTFQGNILALTSITLRTGASLVGRALARNGAVTLNDNHVDSTTSLLATGTFWKGNASNLWSGANWSPDASGAVSALLAPGADVVFSVTGVPPKNVNTLLDVNASISSLTINDPVPITISGPHILSILGTGQKGGITVNSGAGLTTINSGLNLSGSSQLITVNNTAGLLINGVVMGTIGLSKAGAGRLTLTGTNTYTGNTTVLQGTLQIGDGGASGSVLGNVTDDASLVFNRSDIVILAGTVTGLGTLAQSGSGQLILNTANTYSGGTNFNAGILSVASDANLGRGPLTFNGGTLEATGAITSSKTSTLNPAGGTFLADAGTSSTLSGVMSGPGSLTKNGPGEVILTGMNTYSGGTILSNGVLTVGGPQALGTGNMLVNGGALRADPQPINVRGNYTQNAGGTLQLQVAGPNPGQYDTLTVGGNAALGGTLQLISLGFQPKAGNLLTLVTTGGVVSGQFTQFLDPFANAPGVDAVELLYQRKSVQLLFLGLGLDSGLTDTAEGLTALYEISFSNANIQRLNLEDRLDDIRSGSNGFSSNMKVNGANVTRDDKATVDGKSSKNVVEPILQPGPENRWGVWVTGFGDFVSVDADANAKGYNFTTGGVSLGIDYRIGDRFAIGAMGEYSHTWTSLDPSGHVDVDSGRGGLYATWFNHGIYLDGAIYGGYNAYDSHRMGFAGLASGSTEGAEWSTFISGGYDFHVGQLTAGPIASLQYTDVRIDGFSENGSLAPLTVRSGSAESLRSDAGFRLFYQLQIGKIMIEPSLKAAWEHEYKYSALAITAGFADISGPSATFFGPSEGHDSAVVSAGVAVRFTPTISTYINYDGQLGRANYDSNAVTGGVRISF
jgi:outer membrane autotransporter protein